jgi:CBS domain-containing protein
MMNEPLSSIMTRNVITAGPNDKLSVAQEIFMSNRVHHLPVVDGRKLVGILTTYDMFKYHRNNGHHDGVLVKDVMTTMWPHSNQRTKWALLLNFSLKIYFMPYPL